MATGIRLVRNDSDREIDQQIRHLDRLKRIKDQAEADFNEAQERFVKMMESLGQQSASTSSADVITSEGKRVLRRWKATVVSSSTTKVNEVTLKKALGATVWKKVTKTVLDMRKLEDAVATGEVDPVVVASHSEIVPRKAYVRLSVTDDEPDAK